LQTKKRRNFPQYVPQQSMRNIFVGATSNPTNLTPPVGLKIKACPST